MHHIAGLAAAQVGAFFNQAAQITVGKNAQHPTLSIDHRRSAQALDAHLTHQLGKAGGQTHLRNLIAAAHHIADVREQLASERTAGVRAGKVFFLESARI